jgi:hypothetical protein
MHGGDVYVKFWLLNLKERDQSQHLGIGGRIILKLILKEHDGSMSRIRIETDGCL